MVADESRKSKIIKYTYCSAHDACDRRVYKTYAQNSLIRNGHLVGTSEEGSGLGSGEYHVALGLIN